MRILLLSGSFRFGRSFSRVEVPSSARLTYGLSEIFKKSIVTSTSMDTTANSEDKKGFKFKYVSRTRVLSVVFRRY
ncbi:hypothetical protein QL285_027595 [Trifolium repens]|nr:hypothetical protein QL285_027595 [Trifolium repens]